MLLQRSTAISDSKSRICEESGGLLEVWLSSRQFLSTQHVLSRSVLAGMSAGALLQDVFWSLWSPLAWALRSIAGPYPEWVASEATMSSSEQ